MRRLSATEEQLQQIQTKIQMWNRFVRELPVPSDILPAIATGRPELIKLAIPRTLTTEECAKLYALIGGLLETNQVLQQHAALISKQATEVRRGIAGLEGVTGRLEAYADYRFPVELDSDDD